MALAGPYTIGVDFGTESGRAVLVDVTNGNEIASAVYRYPHGVIDERLPEGGPLLPPDFALQDPSDYLRTLEQTIPATLAESGIEPEQIIGIGTDFTACTILPTDKQGQPLCWDNRFRPNPHSWVKLWKHHAAQPEATALNGAALQLKDSFLPYYGGKISSEWFFPKAWQILDEAPGIYEATERLIEAADWIVWQLSGTESRNACTAGYKALWNKETGFPSSDFMATLDPRLKDIVATRMSTHIVPPGTRIGNLSREWAEKLGLPAGIAIAAGHIDAHVAVPATSVVTPGKMVLVMGTSICHMILSREKRAVEGMCGVVADGIVPGFYGYEAGQPALGDIFAWFVENGVPSLYEAEAIQRELSVYELLEERASELSPGESGLLALDWWNGNRSVLVDADLSGLIVGYTLMTKPEEIYRALFEATAFGTNRIIKAFEDAQVAVDELYVCGGLPERSPLLMQIYADVTGKPLRVAASSQTSALGAAMFAAVAAGPHKGGCETIVEAAAAMARLKDHVYVPNADHHRVYQLLYAEYMQLHDIFGRGIHNTMKKLKRLREETTAH
jgi:L-ribulokinase